MFFINSGNSAPKKKVLVVDDEKDITDIFTDFLYKYDVEVDTRHCVMDSHSLVINKPFDLILLDYNMPDYKGPKLVDLLKLTTENETTPIVVISAYLDSGVIAELRQKGVSDFIDKPVSMEKFHKVIDKYLVE